MSFSKRRTVTMMKKNTSVLPGNCYNRRDFHREVSKPLPKIQQNDVPRDYDWDDGDFRVVLRRFNEVMKNYSILHTKTDQNNRDKKYNGDIMYYMCVGYANTTLKFCTRCYDGGKQKMDELYYVDTLHIAQLRRCLCRGCLGHILRQYDKKTKLYYNE